MIGRTIFVWFVLLAIANGFFREAGPWHELLADYNLLAGRIWIMVPVVTLMPVIAFTRTAA